MVSATLNLPWCERTARMTVRQTRRKNVVLDVNGGRSSGARWRGGACWCGGESAKVSSSRQRRVWRGFSLDFVALREVCVMTGDT